MTVHLKSDRLLTILLVTLLFACSNDASVDNDVHGPEEFNALIRSYFGNNIDFDNLYEYAEQDIPEYITKDNTGNNDIINEKATLGRILFYDPALSSDNTISCSSCHQQDLAFSDDDRASSGVNGTTGRHSMRLVNSRFADEERFFWDERATSLEDQTTQPIQDHLEMGFSGSEGDPSFNDLLEKLSNTPYYPAIFERVYGNDSIIETRIQESLAQFIRSIQSFDSRFDEGYAVVNNLGQNFPNYTAQENNGKRLFLQVPNQGGAGCQGCHRAPEFDIDPNSRNNGVIGVIGDEAATDITNTRTPSLRDLVKTTGATNGDFMHDGSLNSLEEVIRHYDVISANPNLDPRLSGGPGGQGQNLNLTDSEIDDLVAFLQTLSGQDIYTNPMWSDPFLD